MQKAPPGQKGLATTPVARRQDGTITGRILLNRPTREQGDFGPAGTLLRIALPGQLPATTTLGRYFLARCVHVTAPEESLARKQEWSIYARRPLFSVGPPSSPAGGDEAVWDLLLPAGHSSPPASAQISDPGYAWLRSLPEQSRVNLIGPLGQPFDFAPGNRTLVIVTDTRGLPLTFPAMHSMLDRGGRVALIWIINAPPPPGLLAKLPIPVEVRMAHSAAEWERHLADILRWGDCLCAALSPAHPDAPHPSLDYHTLAHLIRTHRYRLEPGYAQALVIADLVCGYGACLACVVPTPDGGHTRACLHGPLFPLEAITR